MAAQPQQNKPQEVIINLKAEVQKLKEMRDAIELMKQEGKLANVNENTYRALFNQIEQTIKRMNEGIRDGAIGASGLKSIQRGFESITSSISKMVSQEKSTGMGLTEYNKKLEEAEKTVRDQIAALDELKKKQKELSVTEKGNPKRGQEGQIMAAARKMSRAARGNKGGDTKAEALLKGGDLKGIQDGAAAGDPAATKALQLYNQELERQANEWSELADKIGEAKEQLSQYKAILSEIKSMGAFDESATDNLNKMGEQAGATASSLKTTQTEMEKTNTTSVKVSSGMKKVESSATKAAKTFIKFNVVIKLARQVLKQGIDAVVEMDKALTDMAIVTGQSREVLQSMIPQFNALGRATGATSTEVAGLTAEYMKQGRTMKDSIELAEQTAKAAKISGISTADSIEYMTSAINGFNLAAKDAEHVSDVFAKLGAASATDYKDLAIALSKVSAQANTAGMSMEFTTTLLAKGLEVTQEAPESIGTALKTILARMRELGDYGKVLEDNTSVNKVENALKAVDIALRDTNGQFRDMETIFNELGPKWNTLNTMQQQAIAQAVAGTRQQSRFLAIMQDWDRTVELSNAALEAEGATMYQHAQYAQSLEFSINKLQTAWQGFIAGFTDSNLIRDAFSFVADVMSKLVDGINFLNSISGGLIGTGATLAAAGWVLVSIIKERIQAHREETELRQRQLEQMREQAVQQGVVLGQQQQQTNAMREQVTLQAQLNQETDEYRNIFQSIGDKIGEVRSGFKEMFTDISEGWKSGWEAGTSKTQEKRLKKIKKLENSIRKDEEKGGKKKQKLEKKMSKEKNKVLKTESKALKKQQKEIQKRIKQDQESLTLEQYASLSAEERVKIEERRKGLRDELIKNEEKQEKLQKTITNSSAKQLATEGSLTTVQTANTVLTEAQEQSEKQISKEEQTQLATETAEVIPNTANTVLTEQQEQSEKQKGRSIFSNLGLKLQEVAYNASASIAQIAGFMANPVTLGFAIAALGVLASAGIAAIATSVAGSGKTSESMAESQNKIYENKEKKTSIDSAISEYEELNKKRIKTDEELARMEELEARLIELDEERFKGKSGQTLLDKAKEESARLEEENNRLTKENMDKVKKGAKKTNEFSDRWLFGIDVRSKKEKKKDAVEFLTSDESRLAMEQNAQLQTDSWITKQGFDADKARDISQTAQGMFASISDKDIEALINKLGVEGATTYLDEFALKAAESASTIFDAANDETLNSEEAFIAGIEEYNKQITKAVGDGDQVMIEALQGQYRDYALLADSMEAVTSAIDSGLLSSSISTLATKFNELGFSAEGLSMVLNSLFADEHGNVSVEDMANWDESKWSELASANGKTWSNMTDAEKQAFQNQIMDAVKDSAVAGMTRAQVGDVRAGMLSSAENTADIKAALVSGEDLTQEQQEYMRDNYAELYGSKEYQEAMKTGNTAALISMMENAENKEREKKAAGMNQMAENEIDDFERQIGISYEDYLAGNIADLSDSKLASAQQLAANIQYYKDSAEAVRDFKYEYEGLNELQQTVANNDAIISGLQDKIDKNGGIGTLADYEAMKKAANETAKIAENNFNKTADKMKEMFGDAYNSIVKIDEETGALIVDMKQYNLLTSAEKKLFDAQLEILQEQNDELQNQKQQLEEINEMQREAQVEIQNQALEAMKARLDEEYEATQKSLEKRQELYSKYFDALDAEEDSENYESDRQVLLNKIAALSTATDSESLARLKEAQEELKELDDEQLQNERDMRREAVEESFEKQGEDLDAAYEDAMANVQVLWEEFCAMAGEDQLELFRQYGEGFQEVTDLQRQIAEETLASTMAVISSYGLSRRAPGSTPAFAKGGLVNYTGPAWVDGTKSHPEAFLDAVDTANIASLALGLRTIAANNITTTSNADNGSTFTIESLNITVNGGVDGQQAGRAAADGFIKAIQELGVNINKQG